VRVGAGGGGRGRGGWLRGSTTSKVNVGRFVVVIIIGALQQIPVAAFGTHQLGVAHLGIGHEVRAVAVSAA